MDISPDHLGGGAYNLQSLSAIPERRVCKDETDIWLLLTCKCVVDRRSLMYIRISIVC